MNCIWIPTKCQNKQAQASAPLFSICNKPPERQATASCLARREWNRLYTWENTAHRVAFLIGSRARRWSRRWGPTCRYCGPVCGWGTGEGGERCTAQRRSGEERMLACQWSREGRELSGTPVRRMNKVHLFIPSSFIRCHRLKTGLSKNTAHLFLPASVSLFFTGTWAQTHTLIHTQTKGECCNMRSTQQYHNANIFCLQRYRIGPAVRRPSSFLPGGSTSIFAKDARLWQKWKHVNLL